MNGLRGKRYVIAVLALIAMALIGISMQRPVSNANVSATRPAKTSSQDSPEILEDYAAATPEVELAQVTEPPVIEPVEVPEGCQSATLFFTSFPAKCLVDGKLVSVEPDRPMVFQDGQKYYIVPEGGDK